MAKTVPKKKLTFADHIKAVRRTMQKDTDLQDSYHANIAMRIYDRSSLSKFKSQELANEIMDLLFLR